ncbi:hypothetical protein DAVIS_03222 [Mycobacterium marinum]|uniref:Uncharacterized protein n=1 Tax=Mycobacterium marinum TaxID=1781 RepID=A0A3E2MUE0_MYCMR|nr:hypothetical protein DAVIS_03222 [Mycobacterium marinum]
MSGFEAGDVGDGQLVWAQRGEVIDRVVLVDEQGVKQAGMSGGAVNVAQREVVILEGVGMKLLELVDQFCGGGRGCQSGPDGHGVDQQTHHGLRPGKISGPPRHGGAKRNVMVTGQPGQQPGKGGLQHDVEGAVMTAGQLIEGSGGRIRQCQRLHCVLG